MVNLESKYGGMDNCVQALKHKSLVLFEPWSADLHSNDAHSRSLFEPWSEDLHSNDAHSRSLFEPWSEDLHSNDAHSRSLRDVRFPHQEHGDGLVFRQTLFQLVHDILKERNMSHDYVVYSWRSETAIMSKASCANKIIHSSAEFRKAYGGTAKPVLVCDFSFIKGKKMWHKSVQNTTEEHEALDKLSSAFLKWKLLLFMLNFRREILCSKIDSLILSLILLSRMKLSIMSRLNSNYIHHVISHRKEEGLQHTTFHRWDYDFSKHPTDTHSNSG